MDKLNYWVYKNNEEVFYFLDKINNYLEKYNINVEDKKKFNNDIVNYLYKIRNRNNN